VDDWLIDNIILVGNSTMAIPTLSQWGLIILSLTLVLVGTLVIQKRRQLILSN
ncbi:MAG: IPTL-CTERM sorting domain-containing protein, partial [Saprospiraceae bacterium]|nr:IPTL-CTERM sorting domain-containing protein [Saprospiraceae bacterium]